VLDEPAAHLDTQTRHALAAELIEATEHTALLLISHAVDRLSQPPMPSPGGVLWAS
jgi:ABC-type transport system involved in cytochrome bd biosynthesis fused ATPase/permease subunit